MYVCPHPVGQAHTMMWQVQNHRCWSQRPVAERHEKSLIFICPKDERERVQVFPGKWETVTAVKDPEFNFQEKKL